MKWPFGQRRSRALEILSGKEWTCNSCELPHIGMFDLASYAPDPWPHDEKREPNSAIRLNGDFLSEDFCVLDGTHFLVRCVLEIPVRGVPDKFAFGCWGSLSRENFETYLDHFDEGTLPASGPWWSWLCNRLSPFMEETPLGCWMHPQISRERPVLEVDSSEHPLAIAQEQGVTPETILAIYANYGHSVS